MRYVLYKVDSLVNLDPRDYAAGEMLVLPNGEIYGVASDDELGGIGSVFKSVGKFFAGNATQLLNLVPGGSAFVPLAQEGVNKLFGSGGSGGQAKGLAAIQSAGQQLIAQFATLKQAIASGQVSKADAYAAADKLVSALSDSTYFYQAKSGKDAEALANFKTQAAQLAADVKQTADAADAAQIAQAQQVAQQQSATSSIFGGATGGSGLPFGLSLTELLIIGGGIYFFTRR